MRQIATMRGRDPRIAKLVVSILKSAGAAPRDYDRQAAALLQWVQNPKNFYYVNESGERLQDPIFTIKAGFGDCDDVSLLLTAFFESIHLPWKLVLSGWHVSGQKARFIEGDRVPADVNWSHIYCMVGTPPFNPNRWFFCEPTIQGVPLGWDVVEGDSSYLPEMQKGGGPARVVQPGPAPSWFRPSSVPATKNRSPAWDMALGDLAGELDALGGSSSLGPAVGSAIAEEIETSQGGINWRNMAIGITTGVTVSITTALLLDWIRGEKLWAKGR
jgi:hypothetical protein